MPHPDPVAAPLGVLVIDDEPRHRALVRYAADARTDVVIIGEAHNGRRGVELAGQLQPDVVVLDLRMPTMDGLTALPLILRAAPFARVVIWSSGGPLELEAAVEAGAAACVRKGAPIDQLLAVLTQRPAAA
jgi:DNA-binding NarL/FixJ family response regulator